MLGYRLAKSSADTPKYTPILGSNTIPPWYCFPSITASEDISFNSSSSIANSSFLGINALILLCSKYTMLLIQFETPILDKSLIGILVILEITSSNFINKSPSKLVNSNVISASLKLYLAK